MDFPDAKILLVGAGKMGGALLAAWLRAGVKPDAVTVLETNAALPQNGCRMIAALSALTEMPDCVVLAVKPQSLDALLPELAARFSAAVSQSGVFLSLRERLGEGGMAQSERVVSHPDPLPEGEGMSSAAPLYLSIAAGKTLTYFAKHLGDAPVVRAMPNSPALIGKGISGLCATATASGAQKQLAEALLEAAGKVVWLEDEAQMDAVTAISGSGPAYVFLFLEALIAAGIAQGLPEAIATKLALQTVRGSVKLAMKSDEPLAQLRKNVTSPGGTTEAALKVLMGDKGLPALMHEAVAAAVKRARDL